MSGDEERGGGVRVTCRRMGSEFHHLAGIRGGSFRVRGHHILGKPIRTWFPELEHGESGAPRRTRLPRGVGDGKENF